MFEMRRQSVLFVPLLAVVLHAGFLRSQQLIVQNESVKQTVLTRADIEALPHVKVTASASGGTASKALPSGPSWKKVESSLGKA